MEFLHLLRIVFVVSLYVSSLRGCEAQTCYGDGTRMCTAENTCVSIIYENDKCSCSPSWSSGDPPAGCCLSNDDCKVADGCLFGACNLNTFSCAYLSACQNSDDIDDPPYSLADVPTSCTDDNDCTSENICVSPLCQDGGCSFVVQTSLLLCCVNDNDCPPLPCRHVACLESTHQCYYTSTRNFGPNDEECQVNIVDEEWIGVQNSNQIPQSFLVDSSITPSQYEDTTASLLLSSPLAFSPSSPPPVDSINIASLSQSAIFATASFSSNTGDADTALMSLHKSTVISASSSLALSVGTSESTSVVVSSPTDVSSVTVARGSNHISSLSESLRSNSPLLAQSSTYISTISANLSPTESTYISPSIDESYQQSFDDENDDNEEEDLCAKCMHGACAPGLNLCSCDMGVLGELCDNTCDNETENGGLRLPAFHRFSNEVASAVTAGAPSIFHWSAWFSPSEPLADARLLIMPITNATAATNITVLSRKGCRPTLNMFDARAELELDLNANADGTIWLPLGSCDTLEAESTWFITILCDQQERMRDNDTACHFSITLYVSLIEEPAIVTPPQSPLDPTEPLDLVVGTRVFAHPPLPLVLSHDFARHAHWELKISMKHIPESYAQMQPSLVLYSLSNSSCPVTQFQSLEGSMRTESGSGHSAEVTVEYAVNGDLPGGSSAFWHFHVRNVFPPADEGSYRPVPFELRALLAVSFLCEPPCLHDGWCSQVDDVASDNQCVCLGTGFTGPSCSIPACSPSCVHGRCMEPNRCECDAGWTGDYCLDVDHRDVVPLSENGSNDKWNWTTIAFIVFGCVVLAALLAAATLGAVKLVRGRLRQSSYRTVAMSEDDLL